MRVLLTAHAFPAYVDGHVEDLVQALVDFGDDVCVAARGRGDHALTAHGNEPGRGRLRVVMAPSGDPPSRKLATLSRMVGTAVARNPSGLGILLRELSHGRRPGGIVRDLYVMAPVVAWKADLVHIGALAFAVQLPRLPSRLDVPVVVSCVGNDLRLDPLLGEPHRTRIRTVFDGADLVHCVSSELAGRALALGLDPAKVYVGPWGVDTSFFCPAHDQGDGDGDTAAATRPIRVVSVGRLSWEKSYEYALEAVARLRARGVCLTYSILGDGSNEERLRVLGAVRDLGLEAEVRVCGARSRTEVRQALRSSDVFLLSSVSEGLNGATLEAMAVGLPVVVTDVGGMREAVTDGTEGIVVPARDPDALAEALVTLGRDPTMRRRMGASGRGRATRDFDNLDRSWAMRAEYLRLLGLQGRRVTPGA